MAGTASGMIRCMNAMLGTTEHPPGSNHNEITVWYNTHVKPIGDGPWCDMEISKAAAESGNADVVGQHAYTPEHANWFAARGQWHSGAAGIRPGDVVFFDWSGSRSRDAIDHVGLVVRVEGSKIFTIEGNKGDECVRVTRDSTYIAGYGRPAYAKPMLKAPTGTPVLKKGSAGGKIVVLQRCLNKVQKTKLVEDGSFGDLTKAAVKAFQGSHKDAKGHRLLVDGEYGGNTASAMTKAL